jgi:RecJ-like exonuclease
MAELNSSHPKPSPGDQAVAGTPGTGENICPDCAGTGRIQGQPCKACDGSGKIIEGIGGG